MPALTSRITLESNDPDILTTPEDFLSTSLGVIFPDDVTNQHGDAENSLVYRSPYLPEKELRFEVAEPEGEEDRRLFSHYLWNASLLLGELVERDSLDLPTTNTADGEKAVGERERERERELQSHFDIRGLRTLEVGAGTALPSVLAGILGAKSVCVTDYPAETVLRTLRRNITRNLPPPTDVTVEGHVWGDTGSDFARKNEHAFDRLLVADCLWMPWEHANLRRSISHFMGLDQGARAWVVAGFHTGRQKMKGFFEGQALAGEGLVVERIWEVDCDGRERGWEEDREEDISTRKRWLVVAVLKRL